MASFLIVESEATQCALMQKLLSMRGHESETASSSVEALGKIRLHPPDVITITPMLIDRNGIDFCEYLKSRRLTCLISVIVIFSYYDLQSEDLGFRSGSNAHINVPYAPEVIFRAFEEAAGWREDHAARCGIGEIVIDTRHDNARLRQTNDLMVDILTRTSLPEEEVRGLKRIVLEKGDSLMDWGRKRQCECVALIRSEVERDRISLEICLEGLPAGSPEDPLTMSLDALVKRGRFVESPGRTGDRVVLERIIRL